MTGDIVSSRHRPLTRGSVLALVVLVCATGCGPRKSPSGQVVVYAAEKDEIIQAVSPFWEKAAPQIRLNVIAAGTNEVLQRARAERQRPLGDALWGVGAEGPSALPELFEPYETKEAKAVASHWKDIAKSQPWQPNNIVPMVIIYNTRLVKAAEAPRGWRDLANPRWKNRLAYAAPDKSGSAYTQLATMVSVFGDSDAGWETIDRIMANPKILPSSGKVPKGVADGEYAVGMTYENLAGLYATGGAPIKIVYPVEGTAIIPDANALMRGAPHPKEGKRFLDFLQSRPVQEMLARKLSLRSCRTDVASPPGLPPIESIKAAPGFDFRWAVQRREDFIKKWQAIVLHLKQ
jgi:iron(III) transport system substrate-binding protein